MTYTDSQRTTPPPRLAVDGRGFVWRVYNDGHWSMAPSNPDNNPVPEPVTYYVRCMCADKLPDGAEVQPCPIHGYSGEGVISRLREMHRQTFPDAAALDQADFCHECAMAWPCPTRRVLDGEQ